MIDANEDLSVTAAVMANAELTRRAWEAQAMAEKVQAEEAAFDARIVGAGLDPVEIARMGYEWALQTYRRNDGDQG